MSHLRALRRSILGAQQRDLSLASSRVKKARQRAEKEAATARRAALAEANKMVVPAKSMLDLPLKE